MNKRYTVTILFIAVCLLLPMAAFAQSADEIIKTMDSLEGFDTFWSKGEMVTVDQFGEKKTLFQSWSRGSSDFLIEMLGSEESGQKVLRIGEELYLYYPDAEEVIPMYGSALKQSMFGDISYEDMTEGNDTLSKYKVTLKETEQVNGKECWVMDMEAKTRNVPYPRQTIWVEKGSYMLQKAQYFSRSGKLLKEMSVLEIKIIDGKNVMTHMRIEDKLKRNSSTEMRITEMKANPALENDLFTVAGLSW